VRLTPFETAVGAPGREVVEHIRSPQPTASAPLLLEEAVASLGTRMLPSWVTTSCARWLGITWYFQFFFYTMGETQRGRYKFSSWTLHMASIIIFSSLWGIGFGERKGAGRRAGQLLALALFLLIASTAIVGYETTWGCP
jgi:L-rhamnose-H+ transport protein